MDAGCPIDPVDRARRALWPIHLVHTIAWAIFAGSILAIPVVLLLGNLTPALWLSGLVWVEVLVLAANGMRCPLTLVAEGYTDDRSDNFDIFLPAWLARHNKLIFGSIFTIDTLWLLWAWLLR